MADLKNFDDLLSTQFRGLDGRHFSEWPVLPRILCGFFVFFIVILFGYLGYWSGQKNQLDNSVREEEKLKSEYKNKVFQAVNLDPLRKQRDQVGQYVSTLEKQLPNKAEMDALLSDINQAGLGRGLQFELFKPGQVLVRDYYAELPISIKISGSYHDIAAFTSDLANLPRIVTLNNMSLVSGKDDALTLEAIVKTFRYLDPDEVQQQRKTNEKKGAKP